MYKLNENLDWGYMS